MKSIRAIRYLATAREGVQVLPPEGRQRIKAALQAMLDAKSAQNLDIKRLLGTFDKPLWRLRVGAWRVVFFEDQGVAYVVRVFPRSQGYDWIAEWAG